MAADPTPVNDAPQDDAGQAQEAQAPDLSAVMSRFDELSQQVQSLSQPPAASEPEWQGGGIGDLPYQDYGTDPNEFQGFDPQADPYGQDPYQPGQYAGMQQLDPAQQQQAAQAQLQQYIQQAVQQATEPLIIQQKAEALEAKYTELKDPAKAAAVMKETSQWAKRIGRPDLARSPELVELVHLAQMAKDRAAQETPANGGNTPEVHLEGSGAAPQAQEADAGDRMLAAWGVDPNNPW